MRVTGRTIVVFVALVGVFSFVFGWVITREVRGTAIRTDARLEAVAAAIEAYAAAHGGDMPTSEAQLRAGVEADKVAAPDFETGMKFLQVQWPPNPELAPILGANGLPTSIGTLPRVNGRLRSLARGSAANSAVQAAPAAP